MTAIISYAYLYSERYEILSGEQYAREGIAMLRSYEERNISPAVGAYPPG